MTDIPTHLARDEGQFQKYFHVMPNMYDDDLDPYEYRLLGHYKRVGISWEGTRQVATKCKMSVGQVSKTRKALVAKDLLKVELLTRKQMTDRGLVNDKNPDDKVKVCVVSVVDVTEKNVSRYAKSNTVHSMNTPVHSMNTPVHQVNERITTEEDHLKKEEAAAPESEPETPAPNVYAFYEQNIGALTPMLRDMLQDDVKEYTAEWVIDAIKEARISNSTKYINYKYIQAILSRWGKEGKGSKIVKLQSNTTLARPESRPHVAESPPVAPASTPEERLQAVKAAREKILLEREADKGVA